MRNYIPDGYTENGYIAERTGIHEACTFKYRRMLHAARARVHNAGRVGPDAGNKATYLALETHLEEWDVVKIDPTDESKVEVLPIKAVHIARLAGDLIEKLFAVVAGYSASDPLPDQSVTATKDELDAIMEGGNVGDVQAEGHAKN